MRLDILCLFVYLVNGFLGDFSCFKTNWFQEFQGRGYAVLSFVPSLTLIHHSFNATVYHVYSNSLSLRAILTKTSDS